MIKRIVLGAALSVGLLGAVAVPGVAGASVAHRVPLTKVYGSGSTTSGWSNPRVGPSSFRFGAGSHLALRSIHWATWNRNSARGTGTRVSCPGISGNCTRTRVTIVLSNVRAHTTQRAVQVLYFSDMTIRHGSGRPGHLHWGRHGGTAVFWG